MAAPLLQARIVLVRPRNPLNIGAAARAMKNFQLNDLMLVAPHEPIWQESRSAPGAQDLLASARTVRNLEEAVTDCNLVLGTSSLARRQTALSRDSFPTVVALDQLCSFWQLAGCPERLALVFGPEKTGLTNRDLAFCHAVLRIPTAADCPSMNLGQAVAVCCYEIRRLRLVGAAEPTTILRRATSQEIDRLACEIEKLLGNETARGREKRRLERLRQLLLRWPLTSQDVTFALGVIRDLAWRLENKAPRGASEMER